jgi:phage terminase Nu1 subunit (DNA packaging protein)
MFNKLNTLQLSQAVGCHRTTIHRWVKVGLPRNKDKTFDLPKVILWMIDREKEAVIDEQALSAACDSPALERYRTARAAMAELDLEIREGEWVKTSTFDQALAQRAIMFKSDLTTLAHSGASEICNMVGGDRSRIPELIEHLLDKFETLLGRYSAPASLT